METASVRWRMLTGQRSYPLGPVTHPHRRVTRSGSAWRHRRCRTKLKSAGSVRGPRRLAPRECASALRLRRCLPVEHLGLLREGLATHRRSRHRCPPGYSREDPRCPGKAAAATKEERTVYQSRAHAATLLAALGGSPECGGFTLQRTPDRTERTLFTLAAAPAGVLPATLAKRLRTEIDPGVRFAILITLSSYRAGDLPESELSRFLEWLRNAWLTDPDRRLPLRHALARRSMGAHRIGRLYGPVRSPHPGTKARLHMVGDPIGHRYADCCADFPIPDCDRNEGVRGGGSITSNESDEAPSP